MLLFKIIGTLFVCGAGIGFTVFAIRFERCKLQILDAYIALIFYIKGQIDSCAMPIGEILRGAGRALAEFPALAVISPDEDPIDKSSVYYLDRESLRLLRSFFSELGSLYREEQLRRCDYYIEALTSQRQKLHEMLPARLRLVCTLVLCTAAGITILLW
ncbi:unknown [Clostridium sp. CAG:448]|nr:unknown [Clostridium sp. CAG:448]